MKIAEMIPGAGSFAHLRWSVVLPESNHPDEPVALFARADCASILAKANYPGQHLVHDRFPVFFAEPKPIEAMRIRAKRSPSILTAWGDGATHHALACAIWYSEEYRPLSPSLTLAVMRSDYYQHPSAPTPAAELERIAVAVDMNRRSRIHPASDASDASIAQKDRGAT